MGRADDWILERRWGVGWSELGLGLNDGVLRPAPSRALRGAFVRRCSAKKMVYN